MGTGLEYWENYFDKHKAEILPENVRSITTHIRKMKAASRHEHTITNHYQALTQFGIWCGEKTFTKLTEEDLLDYADWLDRQNYAAPTRKSLPKKGRKLSQGTKYTKLATVKTLLKELNVPAVSAINIKPQLSRKLPEDLLTKNDIDALIDAAPNTRDRALISVLYESGMRRGEMFSIKIKNVTFDENGSVVTIPTGKTGARRIRLVFASSFLRQWLDVHPRKLDREAPVFCSLSEPFNVLSETGLRYQMRRIAEKAHIHKRINPHMFRHARCTHLAEHLTEQQLKSYVGWTAGSDMAKIYVHLSGKDVDNAILRMNGIEIDDTHTDGLKIGRCPRCKDLNPETSLFCGKCGMPLKDEIKQKINADMAEIDLEIMRAVASNPAILDELAKRVSKLQNNKSQYRV